MFMISIKTYTQFTHKQKFYSKGGTTLEFSGDGLNCLEVTFDKIEIRCLHAFTNGGVTNRPKVAPPTGVSCKQIMSVCKTSKYCVHLYRKRKLYDVTIVYILCVVKIVDV